jgi:carboxylesterase type B
MVLWSHAASLGALLVVSAPSVNAAALSVRNSGSSNGLLVDTSSGKVQGFYNDTAHDVRAFLGVPFAAAPTGLRRFMPPVKRARSKTTIQATSWPAACPGLYPNATTIYTLLPYGNKLLPVLVYVYGGGFNQGGNSISTYEGTDLVANHDVSPVTTFFVPSLFLSVGPRIN